MADQHVRQFKASMNDHGGKYKSFTTEKQTFVVELERHRRMGSKEDRGRVVVWEKPRGGNPREDRWTDRVSKWGEYDLILQTYNGLDSRADMEDLISEKNKARGTNA